MSAASGRFAVYYAPAAGTPWSRFGTQWLGRDESTGECLQPPTLPGWSAPALAALTQEPRRYGWHATLKAPFRPTVDAAELRARLDALAATQQPVPLTPLVPVYLDGFLALVPAARNPALVALAAHCVTALDDLRAAPTAADLARRRADTLDARGRELLALYGYPHVMERFRFHMTLTGACDTHVAGELVAHLGASLARLNEQAPPVLDRLCLFHEPAPGADFRRVHDAVFPT